MLGHGGEFGADVRIYVDPTTHLIRRFASSISSPQLGTSALTIDLLDYARHDGVQLPTKTVQVIENLWRTEMSYTETELGIELDDDLFEKPEARQWNTSSAISPTCCGCRSDGGGSRRAS